MAEKANPEGLPFGIIELPMPEQAHLRLSPAQRREPPDPWRRRMTRTADTLRRLDPCRFAIPIARIEEYLRVDAGWNLEAALACCRRQPNPQS
jgi:hypothetical protein